MKENILDLQTSLTQTETGRIVTKMRERGIRLKYRELIGFSPIEAANISTCKRYSLTAKAIAEAAGRGTPEENKK